MQLKTRGCEIAGLLDSVPDDVTTLSLDCFDTLIWRNTQCAHDVFADIGIEGGCEPRIWSEKAARRSIVHGEQCAEVTLDHIYRHLLPNADDAGREAAIAKELAIEARHCFAFTPTVDLMRAAKARGMRIVIVSDMYLSHDQLVDLIGAVAGDDVLRMVNRVFVSSEYGVGKSGGLFRHVLNELGVAPDTVLHVGDNPRADHQAALEHGMHAALFRQFDAETERRLRHEAAAAVIIDPRTRIDYPACQAHRAQVSLRRDDDPAFVLGHDAFGPVMHGFALWVKRELDAMAARLDRPVRPLFLMRDGHLPFEAFEALYPDAGARKIELSRLVATRAGLIDWPTVDRYLNEWVDRIPLSAIARNILLFDHEVAKLVKGKPGADPRPAFLKAVRQPAMREKILKRARLFGDKLVAHLNAAGIADGDAVMLVDVGYAGTVQNMVEPMLRARMNLDVAGRYLLLREGQMTGLDKRGMIGVDRYEYRTVHALTTCVAVVEQLCNVAQGSTIDYQPDGTPIRAKGDFKAQQNDVRDRAQAACIQYVRECGAGVLRAPGSDDVDARVRAAAASLARLMFMPSEAEARLFEDFDLDNNVGTDAMIKFIDSDHASRGLRRRGLSYINETSRMYIPGELQRHGLPLNLSLFSASRFGLELRDADFDVGAIRLPVILSAGNAQQRIEFDAVPTVEGYYRAVVPLGNGKFTPAINFGALCEWVQIEEARLIGVDQFKRDQSVAGHKPVLFADAMIEESRGLYRCTPAGFLMAQVPPASGPILLEIVFRPVVWRTGETLRAVA